MDAQEETRGKSQLKIREETGRESEETISISKNIVFDYDKRERFT